MVWGLCIFLLGTLNIIYGVRSGRTINNLYDTTRKLHPRRFFVDIVSWILVSFVGSTVMIINLLPYLGLH